MPLDDVPASEPVSASSTWVVKRMRPMGANVAGSVHGGVVLQLCDEAEAAPDAGGPPLRFSA